MCIRDRGGAVLGAGCGGDFIDGVGAALVAVGLEAEVSEDGGGGGAVVVLDDAPGGPFHAGDEIREWGMGLVHQVGVRNL